MYRIGIIGASSISKAHADAVKSLLNRAILVAVAEISREAGQKFAEEYDCSLYESYEDMLCKEDLDVVCCCLPHALHYESGKAVLKAGLHLFIEKPMCITTKECDRLNAISVQKKCFIMVGHTHQYLGPLLQAKKLVDKGKIGKLTLLQTEIIGYYDWENRNPWHLDPKLGGGVLMNNCPHQLDQLLFFAESPVRSVRAAVVANRRGIAVDSDICALVEFENGVLGNLTALQAYKTDKTPSLTCRLIGTGGAIRFSPFGNDIILAYGNQREQIKVEEGVWGYKLEWKEFLDALDKNCAPRTDGRYGHDIVELTEMMVSSYIQRKEIQKRPNNNKSSINDLDV